MALGGVFLLFSCHLVGKVETVEGIFQHILNKPVLLKKMDKSEEKKKNSIFIYEAV